MLIRVMWARALRQQVEPWGTWLVFDEEEQLPRVEGAGERAWKKLEKPAFVLANKMQSIMLSRVSEGLESL
jgi:hypothetical protein